MAAISPTAASVVKAAGSTTATGTAGETITAGMSLYLGADNKIYKAQCDGTANQAACIGIALTGSSLDQPITYLSSGGINLGATLTVGETYVVGTAFGGINPIGDLVSTNYVTILGIATTASNLAVDIQVSATQKP